MTGFTIVPWLSLTDFEGQGIFVHMSAFRDELIAGVKWERRSAFAVINFPFRHWSTF